MTYVPLLDLLRCPETRQPLTMAEPDLIARLNERIRAGQLQNRAGRPVSQPIDGGLMREDRQCLFPVREEIPILLIDEAIPL
ncbi:MAG TPA: hypothetical protein VNO52_17765 [Methylomirabilota bacterium]|nr:hypothetical protein [Methylomirabilota bacterium]